VLLEGLTDSRHATSTARRILRSLAQLFKLDGANVQISASIGIAVGTSGGPRSMLHAADSAMYKAKSSGPGQMVKAV